MSAPGNAPVVSPVVDAGNGLALTVPALLRARAAERADHPLLICDDEVLTYAAAERRAAALAKGLLVSDAGKGTHIGLLHPNGADFVVGWLAAARIGAVTLPFSTFSTAAELRTLLRGADVGVVLAAHSFRSHDYLATLGDAVPELDLGAPPPFRSPTVPTLRRIAFRAGPGVPAGWSLTELIVAAAVRVPSGHPPIPPRRRGAVEVERQARPRRTRIAARHPGRSAAVTPAPTGTGGAEADAHEGPVNVSGLAPTRSEAIAPNALPCLRR